MYTGTDRMSYADAMDRLQSQDSRRRLGGHTFPGAMRSDGSLYMTENTWIDIANTESKNGRGLNLQKGRGIDTVFLIDTSESMSGQPFERATNVVLTFLDVIESISKSHGLTESVALVTMGDKTEVLQHLTCDYASVRAKLGSIQVGGRTPMMAGLYMVLAAINGGGSISVMNGYHVHPRIIVLTDAKPTDSESTTGLDSSMYGQEEIDQEIEVLANRLGVEKHPIYCINVGNMENPMILDEISRASNGRVMKCDEASVKQLGRHFKNVAAVTRLRKHFSLNIGSGAHFRSIMTTYERDVQPTDLEDMMAFIREKLADSEPEDYEYIDASAPAVGTRVSRGPQWNHDNLDGEGAGTIVGHSQKPGIVKVEWDVTRERHDHCYLQGSEEIVKTAQPRRLLDSDLIAPGCLVCRGDDWKWGHQDGGSENIGVVYDVQSSGMVHVRWPNHHTNWYRFGADGMFDVTIWEPTGGYGDQHVSQPGAYPPSIPPAMGMGLRPTPDGAMATPVDTRPHVEDLPSVEVDCAPGLPMNGTAHSKNVTKPIVHPVSQSGGTMSQSKGTDSSVLQSNVHVVGGHGDLDLTTDHAMDSIDEQTKPKVSASPKDSDSMGRNSNSPRNEEILDSRTSASLSADPPQSNAEPSKDEDVVYTQEDIEWCWYDKKKNIWISFSVINTDTLEREHVKKGRSKIIYINSISYRVYLNTMKMQKVNSRESTLVKRAVIPQVIRGMTKEMVDRYMKLLTKGSNPSTNIRLMVVGNDRVGKTTLCRNMLKDKNFGNIEGTDGIDVFVNSYQINMKTKARRKLGQSEHEVAKKKMASAAAFERLKEEDDEDGEENEEQDAEKDKDSEQVDMDAVPRTSPVPISLEPRLTGELADNRIEQIHIDQPITLPKKTKPGIGGPRQNYPVPKQQTREKTIPTGVMDDVYSIIEEAKRLQSGGTAREEGDVAYLSLWDFGGEKIFYDTHHIFLSKDAVYLLCFDLDKCIKDGENIDQILFWLRSIATYSACNGKSKGPPIILVGTHSDMMEGTEEEKKEKFHCICSKILNHKDVQPIKEKIRNYFLVDNKNEGDPIFDQILDSVIDAAPSQAQWKRDIPTKWLALEREIMKEKGKDCKVKTFQEIVELDRGMEAPIGEIDDIKLFLRYLHQMGYVLYYDDDMGMDGPNRHTELPVIIDLQWVIYGFRRLITNPKNIKDKGQKSEVMWTGYLQNGQLTDPLITFLWQPRMKDDKEDFQPYKEILLSVMERLGLIAPPVSPNSVSDNPQNLNFYIVPSMLKDVNPTWVTSIVEADFFRNTATLLLTLEQQFISLPVFHKLLAVCLAKFKTPTKLLLSDGTEEEYNNTSCIRKGFGIFQVAGAWNVILAYDSSAIKVTMFKYDDVEISMRAGVGVDIRSFLEDTIVDVLRLQGQNTTDLAFKYFLSFCVHQSTTCTSKETLDELKDGDKVVYDRNRFIYKSDLKPWFCSETEKGEAVPVAKFLPECIRNRNPDAKLLGRISRLVCFKTYSEKRQFGFELGLEDSHVNTILSDNEQTPDQTYHMLTKWKELNKKRKVGDIVRVMKKLELDCKFWYKKGKLFDE